MQQARHASRALTASEKRVRRAAQEDALTGMPNRGRVIGLLDAALSQRAPDRIVAFICVNLDGFKDVNETLGHSAGDEVLIAAAARLDAAKPRDASVGRIGGDEFALVMPTADDSAPLDAAKACARAMSLPFMVDGRAVAISASIGLAQAPADGDRASALIRRADLAARAAKKTGRGRILAFHSGLEAEINERRFIERELRRALANHALEMAYQPIVAGDGLRILGAEALVRWRHPVRGAIPPAVFVAVAEQTGLMMELGRFVLRRALADACQWSDRYIAINLSPIQVRDRALVRSVAEALDETGIDPTRVVLEITEGVLIDNPEQAKQRLKELRALGVKIALDDFGSGYSSLSYLRRLPIDKLKIDKEFVSPLGRSANGGVIVQAIVALGRALGLSVLAEGVETEEQRVLLRLAGCDELQGYLFGRPMPHAALVEFLARRTPSDGWDAGVAHELLRVRIAET
jgi:diguanylate cyclase (GGDEF)-like protein